VRRRDLRRHRRLAASPPGHPAIGPSDGGPVEGTVQASVNDVWRIARPRIVATQLVTDNAPPRG
jgi:hypothetical protein